MTLKQLIINFLVNRSIHTLLLDKLSNSPFFLNANIRQQRKYFENYLIDYCRQKPEEIAGHFGDQLFQASKQRAEAIRLIKISLKTEGLIHHDDLEYVYINHAIDPAKTVLCILKNRITSENLSLRDYSVFSLCVEAGDLEFAQRLYQMAVLSSEEDALLLSQNSIALCLAVKYNHLPLCLWLWQQANDVQKNCLFLSGNLDPLKSSCIYMAAYLGHEEIFDWLWEIVKQRFDITIQREMSKILFSSAMRSGNLKICERILRMSNSMNKQQATLEFNNYEAFRAAVEGGHLTLCQWYWGMLDREYHPVLLMMVFWHSHSFQLALEHGHIEVCDWLWGLADFENRARSFRTQENFAQVVSMTWNLENYEVCVWLWSVSDPIRQAIIRDVIIQDLFKCPYADDKPVFIKGYLRECQWLCSIATPKQNKDIIDLIIKQQHLIRGPQFTTEFLAWIAEIIKSQGDEPIINSSEESIISRRVSF